MPDYSSRQYWRDRLLGEDLKGFEWLLSSKEILPHVATLLDHRPGRVTHVLHLGCGSSTLGLDMQQHFGERVTVQDADYAISGTERKFLALQADPDALAIPVLHFDALNLRDMLASAPQGGWDILVDKSTADAIACGEPLVTVSSGGSTPSAREPIEVLCENLYQATSSDAVWLCISYSSGRFDFLNGAETRYGWQVQSKTPVQLAKSGEGEIVHRPETGTWAWVLRKT